MRKLEKVDSPGVGKLLALGRNFGLESRTLQSKELMAAGLNSNLQMLDIREKKLYKTTIHDCCLKFTFKATTKISAMSL